MYMNKRQAKKAEKKHYLYGGYYFTRPMSYHMIRVKTREVMYVLRRLTRKGIYYCGLDTKSNSRHRQVKNKDLMMKG